MLFKAFLPKSLSTANIAEVALSTSISVNYTRHKRFWEFILEGKARGQSSRSFVHNFDITERDNLPKGTYYHFLLWNSVDSNFFFILFVKEIKDTPVNQF